ncbi:MAG: cadherin-like beta sandwich domain-containing protein [Lachnospiraceae bacterium]|jgi:hypothetical protein|nr:cadherin-like beta sandwich domain-containing protein [Lachnospiraceae bacterium]
MKGLKRIRRRISVLLAATMALTMAAPALPAYATDYGDGVTLTFDPGTGPDLLHTTNYATGASGATPGTIIAPLLTPAANHTSTVGDHTGTSIAKAGYLISPGSTVGSPAASGAFAGIMTENVITLGGGVGSGARPVLPQFVSGVWPGFQFIGWYKGGVKQDYLPYAYEYEDVTYEARWEGDSSVLFNLTKLHYRDLNSARSSLSGQNLSGGLYTTNAAAWPTSTTSAPGDVIWFYGTAPNVVSETPGVEDPISAAPNPPPGYKKDSAIVKNNWVRRYDEMGTNGGGTHSQAAGINATSLNLTGYMPNDDLTVGYRYVPDTNKTFKLTVRYETGTGATLAPAQVISGTYSAEELIAAGDINIPSITAYQLSSWSVTAGDTDSLATDGVMGVTTMNKMLGTLTSAQTSADLFNATTGVFQGYMPNQPMTIVYVYAIDPSFTTTVTVTTLDDDTPTPNQLDATYTLTPVPTTNFNVNMPQKTGYGYPPALSITSGSFTGAGGSGTITNPTLANPYVTLQTTTGGGTLTVQYSKDLTQTSYWSKLFYYTGAHAHISGPLQQGKDLPADTYDIDDIDQSAIGVTVSADPHYRIKGWYAANSTGQYAGTTDSYGNPTSTPLSTGITVPSGQYKLILMAEEDPADWFTVTFSAGAHGSISGGTNPDHVVTGTTFGSLSLPSTSPDPLYAVDSVGYLGWYDQYGNPMSSTTPILAGGNFEARFVSTVPDDGLLAIPDASGFVVGNDGTVNDGTGTIHVNAPNENREYYVVDANGDVVATQTGSALGTSDFTGLDPGAAYYVYEVSNSVAPLAPGTPFTYGGTPAASQPCEVTIPAIRTNAPNPNYAVQDDPADADSLQRIVVSPAAPGTEYALLDSDGNAIDFAGSNGGWLTPSGSPLEVIFDGLEPGRDYIVVARPVGGTQDPEDQINQGSNVSVHAVTSGTETFTIWVNGGGYVDSVQDAATSGLTVYGSITGSAKAGDTVFLDLYSTVGFSHWEVNSGDASFVSGMSGVASPTIIMPNSDLVVSAVYAYGGPPPDPLASLTYETNSRNFGIYTGNTTPDPANFPNAGMEQILIDLTNNTVDSYAFTQGWPVEYTIQLKKKSAAVASPSVADDVRSFLGLGDEAEVPWKLELSLSRAESNHAALLANDTERDDPSYPLAQPSDPAAITTPQTIVYVTLTRSERNGKDYHVVELNDNGTPDDPTDDTISDTDILYFDPDPNTAGSGFTGTFAFLATVGKAYALVYTPVFKVTVSNPHFSEVVDLSIEKNSAIEDAPEYGTLTLTEWRDPTDGMRYEFVGFSKLPNSTTVNYLPGDEHNSDSPLYTVYKPLAKYNTSPKGTWTQAHDDLKDKIDEANALLGTLDPSSQEYADLQNAINDANLIYNDWYWQDEPDIALGQSDLQAAINAANGSGGGPGPGPGASSDADLGSLSVTTATGVNRPLSPSFTPGNTGYTVTVAAGTSGVTIAGVTSDPGASYVVTDSMGNVCPGGVCSPLSAGSNIFYVTVTAADGTVKTYTVTITVASGGGSGGGSGGSGGSGGGSSSSGGGPTGSANLYRTYAAGIDGNWNNFDQANHGWEFILTTGAKLTATWANVRYTWDGVTELRTYHFDANGVMDSGWFLDSDGNWYYLSEDHDGWFGHVVKGWSQNPHDGRWYYLSPVTGKMVTGWQLIDSEWYYFTASNTAQTWTYNAAQEIWQYTNTSARPLGSLYVNETTPDGFPVGVNGNWLRETP